VAKVFDVHWSSAYKQLKGSHFETLKITIHNLRASLRHGLTARMNMFDRMKEAHPKLIIEDLLLYL